MNYYWMTIDDKLYKESWVYFIEVILKTDYGWILETFKQENIIVMNRFENDITTRNNRNGNELMSYNILIEKDYILYTRKYLQKFKY